MADEPKQDRPTSNLTRDTLKGLQWAYLGTAIGGVVQFLMMAVMARLLTPSAFGLIALAGLFLRFVDYFAKAGVTQALVQRPNLTDHDIRAAFTLSAGLAVAFSLVVLAAAPLAGVLANDSDVVPILRWLTIGLVLQGLGGPSVALLRRRLRFQALAVLQIGSYVFGYVAVGITLALAGAGAYALVGAMLAQAAVNTTSAYVLVRHSVLPTRAGGAYRAILGFGARVSVVGFFEFLQASLDTLFIGRWEGATQLGLYNRAKTVAELPSYHLMRGLSQVLFPSFSAIQLDRDRLLKAYISAVGAAAAILLPLNAGMAVASTELVLVVLGPSWVSAIEVLPWLLLTSAIALTGHFAAIVAEAQAALNAKIAIAVASTATLILLLSFASGRSLAAYGAAMAGAALVSHLGHVFILIRTLDSTFRTLTRPYVRALVGAGSVAGVIAIARISLVQAGSPPGIILTAEVVAGALTLAISLRVGPMRVYRDDFTRRLSQAGMLAQAGSKWHRPIKLLLGIRDEPPPTARS